MSLDVFDLVSSLMTVLLLATWFVGVFLAGAAMRRAGRAAGLALLAFVVPIVGTLAGWGATAWVRSAGIDPTPKFLVLTAGNLARGLSLVVSYAILYVALFGRPNGA